MHVKALRQQKRAHVPISQVGKLRHRGAVSSTADWGIPFHQLQRCEYGTARLNP